jgi:hypothetical protein
MFSDKLVMAMMLINASALIISQTPLSVLTADQLGLHLNILDQNDLGR